MYTLDADRSKAERSPDTNALVGARAVFTDDAGGPEVELHWTRDAAQTGAQFRAMLLGAGTVKAPQGELGAWLEHLNAATDTEEPLQ